VTNPPLPLPPRPAQPRILADVVVVLLIFLFLGLPSIPLALTGWNEDFLLFGIQRLFTAGDVPPVWEIIRKTAGIAATLGMPIAVVWRASHPHVSTIVVGAFALIHFLTATVILPIDLVIFLSLYSVTVHGSQRASRLGVIAGCLGAGLIAASFSVSLAGFEIIIVGAVILSLGLTLVLLAWGAGLLRRARLLQRESLRERAIRLERERDQQAQLATIAERNRIAREMHDVVAHSLSVIVAQADGGRYAGKNNPEAATKALETIAETSRNALVDIRGVLGILRHEDHVGSPTSPEPTEADIPLLIHQVEKTGLTITHNVIGEEKRLPTRVGSTVYRVVQEALTNVVKHVGPQAHVQLIFTWEPAVLVVTVTDDGSAHPLPQTQSGHGLVGMKERAALVGGKLCAGPILGGGFQVDLTIPLTPNSELTG